jgi:pyocin large subunit-like protein
MSSLLYGRAKRIKVGDRSAKLFLLILCDYADENNRAWPSIDRLMAEGEASASTVQRALRYLEDHGLITRDEDYGTRYRADRSPYVYHITLDGHNHVEYKNRKNKQTTKKRGSTSDTPSDSRGSTSDTPSDSRGSTHDTPQPNHGVSPMTTRGVTHDHHGVSPMTPRGVTHDHHGVSPMTPRGVTHDTQSLKEPSLEPPRESTRAQKTKTTIEQTFDSRKQALALYQPTPDLTALAAGYGLDPDWELEKFKDTCRANGKIPYDLDAAWRNWVKRGRELNIGTPTETTTTPTDQATELERRARKLLDTSTPLKNRQPDDGERLRWLPHVTRLLAQGTDAARIVELLCQAIDRGELDEAA